MLNLFDTCLIFHILPLTLIKWFKISKSKIKNNFLCALLKLTKLALNQATRCEILLNLHFHKYQILCNHLCILKWAFYRTMHTFPPDPISDINANRSKNMLKKDSEKYVIQSCFRLNKHLESSFSGTVGVTVGSESQEDMKPCDSLH